MTTWNDATEAAPELAGLVRKRFEDTGLGLLATLRADGSPRICGVEPSFWAGELWLGMMYRSRKAIDLLRDPRMALHAATVDKEVTEGDVRVSGLAVEVGDDEVKRGMGAAFAEVTGFDPNDHGPFHLFRVEVGELSTIRAGGEVLLIDVWRPGGPPRRIERGA